jgi:hypothetical protein
MKTLFTALFILLALICFSAEANAPRVVSISGSPHPKAQIVAVDAATGTLLFAYLKADGTRADSGNSIARFTPPEPLPKDKPSDPTTYPEISDAVLAAAIQATG